MGGQPIEPTLLPTGKNATEHVRDGERIPDRKGGGGWRVGDIYGRCGGLRVEVTLSKLIIVCNELEMDKILGGGRGRGDGGWKGGRAYIGSSIPKCISMQD
jgi:hypothetical protein